MKGASLLQFEVGFFENSRRSIEKAVAQHAVDDTMVVRKRQVHHGANRDRVGAVNFSLP